MNSFKTPQGRELPLLDLHGKAYLQVAHRIVWFRDAQPTWGIVTHLLEKTADYALFKAEITNETGRVISTGTQDCYAKEFPDYVAKAETSAIGRALACAGFGTAFAPDLDEGTRLADSPLPRVPTAAATSSHKSAVVGTTSSKWDHQGAKKPFDKSKQDPNKLISDKQIKFLFARAAACGWDISTHLTDYVRAKYGVNDFIELTNKMLDETLEVIQQPPMMDEPF